MKQYRYFTNIDLDVCYILQNYQVFGQRMVKNLHPIVKMDFHFYWLNVPHRNPSNQKDIFLPFYQVDKDNIFRESLTIIQSIIKDVYSTFKWSKQINSPSFEPLSINSNRQSTPISVYLIFHSSTFGSFLKRTHPPKTTTNESNQYRQNKGIN